jgi:hypothetical protein
MNLRLNLIIQIISELESTKKIICQVCPQVEQMCKFDSNSEAHACLYMSAGDKNCEKSRGFWFNQQSREHDIHIANHEQF